MSIIFLDDNKNRIRAFKQVVSLPMKIAETAEECINLIKEVGEVDILFLDHDLGDEEMVDSAREDCGMEVVRWIVDHDPFIRQIIVHSHNGPAAIQMLSALHAAQYRASYIPFSIMIKRAGEISGNT